MKKLSHKCEICKKPAYTYAMIGRKVVCINCKYKHEMNILPISTPISNHNRFIGKLFSLQNKFNCKRRLKA